ncbi:unnamed protein product [Jaminaea pallidilutea]
MVFASAVAFAAPQAVMTPTPIAHSWSLSSPSTSTPPSTWRTAVQSGQWASSAAAPPVPAIGEPGSSKWQLFRKPVWQRDDRGGDLAASSASGAAARRSTSDSSENPKRKRSAATSLDDRAVQSQPLIWSSDLKTPSFLPSVIDSDGGFNGTCSSSGKEMMAVEAPYESCVSYYPDITAYCCSGIQGDLIESSQTTPGGDDTASQQVCRTDRYADALACFKLTAEAHCKDAQNGPFGVCNASSEDQSTVVSSLSSAATSTSSSSSPSDSGDSSSIASSAQSGAARSIPFVGNGGGDGLRKNAQWALTGSVAMLCIAVAQMA